MHLPKRCHTLRLFPLLLCLFLTTSFCVGQGSSISPTDPLPQDTGTPGLKQMLLRLHTTARMLQADAHPDDEDGGMLTLESRGKGVTITLFTLNRGEGGQNKVGSNLFDVLGVLRSLEVTAADRYYGVEERFSRVADFGYSKNPEETFQKWHGHDIPLGDMVRVIRTFRPDVLVARFSGTSRDGHGHHEASGILTQEAFHAAADPTRFPEQIKEGLLPWQTKKLYIGNVCGFMASTCGEENYTVKLNTGESNPALGMTYIQFAMEGLRHQLSQGAGAWTIDAGPHFAYYKLVDSVIGASTSAHEQDFFDGVDTSLPGLASRLGSEENKVASLRTDLLQIAALIDEGTAKAEKTPESSVEPLFDVTDKLSSLLNKIERSDLSSSVKADLLQRLREKYEQAEAAFNFASNISLAATAVSVGTDRTSAAISAGQQVELSATFHNGGKQAVQLDEIALQGFQGWGRNTASKPATRVEPGKDASVKFSLQVPPGTPYTRPYWHRDNPAEDALNIIDDPTYVTLPFPPSPFHVTAKYSTVSDGHHTGQIASPVFVHLKTEKRPLAIAPAFSVMLQPGQQIIPVDAQAARSVRVAVSCNLNGAPPGSIHLEVPSGWQANPADLAVNLNRRGETSEFEFKVSPSALKTGKTQIRAILNVGGKKFTEGYTAVERDDLDTFYYYQPATQRVSIVDVKIPPHLKIGYVMGAGDDIATVLSQVGLDVTQLPAEKLAAEELNKYATIILGIRAYDTQKDVAANNKRLLDYVSNGGTLILQYNAAVGDFNSGHYTPFPAQFSRSRVSVEEAPVEILAPEDSVFHYPNQITQADFNDWVQERGLYFMDQWDDHFKPLLSSHDPGEQPMKGGLMRAQYGKGTYIYAGYAFFRQLPAGVPGAIRLYVNLLSAGHDGK